MLRIEAVLRRGRGQADRAGPPDGRRPRARRRRVPGLAREREIELSPTEFRLLRYLMLNAGRVVSRTQIIDHVWDYGFAIDPSGVETYISYLRRKLDDRDARLIRTVRGFGYALARAGAGAVGEQR